MSKKFNNFWKSFEKKLEKFETISFMKFPSERYNCNEKNETLAIHCFETAFIRLYE